MTRAAARPSGLVRSCHRVLDAVDDLQPREPRSGSCPLSVSAREDDNRQLPSGLLLSGRDRRVGGSESGPQLGAAVRTGGLSASWPDISAGPHLNLRVGLEVQPPGRRARGTATSGHNNYLLTEALVLDRRAPLSAAVPTGGCEQQNPMAPDAATEPPARVRVKSPVRMVQMHLDTAQQQHRAIIAQHARTRCEPGVLAKAKQKTPTCRRQTNPVVSVAQEPRAVRKLVGRDGERPVLTDT